MAVLIVFSVGQEARGGRAGRCETSTGGDGEGAAQGRQKAPPQSGPCGGRKGGSSAEPLGWRQVPGDHGVLELGLAARSSRVRNKNSGRNFRRENFLYARGD